MKVADADRRVVRAVVDIDRPRQIGLQQVAIDALGLRPGQHFRRQVQPVDRIEAVLRKIAADQPGPAADIDDARPAVFDMGGEHGRAARGRHVILVGQLVVVGFGPLPIKVGDLVLVLAVICLFE